jgi:ribose 1,5-bisphosphokinase
MQFYVMTPPAELRGRLIYLMGPSGSGKDTLMSYARARTDPAAVVFAHRYITRAVDAGSENHVTLSDAEFKARRDAGLFALTWDSYGLWYGIGAEINLWLTRGLIVVVSGSRAAAAQAQACYPDLLRILVDAPLDVRAKRLATRGRETTAVIRMRLEREVSLPTHDGLHFLDNSGPIGVAGEALIKLLEAAGGRRR